MPSTAVVACEAHRIGEVRTGLWCESCALPSAVEVDVNLVSSASLRTVARRTFTVCRDCGRNASKPR